MFTRSHYWMLPASSSHAEIKRHRDRPLPSSVAGLLSDCIRADVARGYDHLGHYFGLVCFDEPHADRAETAVLSLRMQSGSMRLVGMQRILNIAVCPSGLRIGMMRIFGIFCRDFFVPWEEISVSRQDRFLWKAAKISFGTPAVGSLSIAAEIADRLARSAEGRWPEPGPFPEETNGQALSRIVKQWAVTTCLAAAFFIIATRLLSHNQSSPPIAVAILFPVIVFGVVSVFRYFGRSRR
jgi:hypothetical protein